MYSARATRRHPFPQASQGSPMTHPSPPITIDKGVPLTERRQLGGRPSKYPLTAMEIGDSFAVPYEGRSARATVARSCFSFAARNPPTKFAIRRVTENGADMLRVWRIA